MIASKIPTVLYRPMGNSLSIERTLKLAIELLKDAENVDEDKVLIAIDDLETMLRCLDRSGE